MPAYSRKKGSGRGKANLVKYWPNLPPDLVYSDITVNYSFQGFPTVSVKAEGIKEQNFASIRKYFLLGNKIGLLGNEYELSQFSWSKEKFEVSGERYNFYSITANYDLPIKRKLEKGVKVKNISSFLSYGSHAYNTNSKEKNKNTKPPKISIQKLCSAIDVAYSGPEALIPVPDEDPESVINVGSLLQEVARSKGCYIEYGSTVKLISWGSADNASISEDDVFEDGENTETFPPFYEGVELNWDRENEELGDEEEENEEADVNIENRALPPRYNFVRVDNKIQTLTEQDVDPDKPPKDTKVLRDMSSLFWESGPTRQAKTTTLYDGTEIKSELNIFGFSYQAKDIAQEDGLLFSSEPHKYWRVCESNRTTRIYQPIGNINLKVTGVNKANKKNVRLVLHPDYANLGKISTFASDGYLFSFQPKVEYLTGINSIGWKLMPLEKEPGPGQDLSDVIDPTENPRAKVQIPIEIPKEDRTAYKLGSARSYYRQEDQNQNLPFQVEFSTFRELPKHIQDAAIWQMDINPIGPDDLIGIVTPDPSYVEPMVVLTESRNTNSFMYAADPDSTDENPLKPLVAGEEGYFRLDRTILDADKYRESITEYTATDPGYKASLTISRTAEKSGQAPQGESRQIKYDKKESQDYWEKRTLYTTTFQEQNKNNKKKKNLPKVFVDSPWQGEKVASSASLNFPYATSREEALTAAKVALEMEHCQSAGSHNKSVSWFFPSMRDGQRVSIDGGMFRILSLSVSIQQIGTNVKPIDGFVQLTSGTKVVLGPEVPRSVTDYESPDKIDEDPMEEALDPNQGSVAAGDGETQVAFIGGETELGDVLEPDSTRRKF